MCLGEGVCRVGAHLLFNFQKMRGSKEVHLCMRTGGGMVMISKWRNIVGRKNCQALRLLVTSQKSLLTIELVTRASSCSKWKQKPCSTAWTEEPEAYRGRAGAVGVHRPPPDVAYGRWPGRGREEGRRRRGEGGGIGGWGRVQAPVRLPVAEMVHRKCGGFCVRHILNSCEPPPFAGEDPRRTSKADGE